MNPVKDYRGFQIVKLGKGKQQILYSGCVVADCVNETAGKALIDAYWRIDEVSTAKTELRNNVEQIKKGCAA